MQREAISLTSSGLHGASAFGDRLSLAAKACATRRLHWVVGLFVGMLILPPEAGFSVGTVFLSPQRLVLLTALLPSIGMLLAGRGGAIRFCDHLIVMHALWALITFIVNHGVEQGMKSGGIYSVEILGPYLLARIFVRDLQSFRSLVSVLTGVVISMALFTVPEALTGKHVLRDLFRALLGDAPLEVEREPRLGLTRAYGTFQHPILYGVFCSSALALSWYVLLGGSPARRAWRSGAIIIATFMSVSSGALLAIVVQIMAATWDLTTSQLRSRWITLCVALSASYAVVEVLSNRDASTVFISYLTLNPATGYTRQVIWDYGSAEVWRNPVFGLGFHDWHRPEWMHSSSVDNFWLLTTMRHGLPGFLTLAGGLAYIIIRVARAKIVNRQLQACRAGWLICMVALSTAAATVHFWGSALTFYCFLLGSSMWLLDASHWKK